MKTLSITQKYQFTKPFSKQDKTRGDDYSTPDESEDEVEAQLQEEKQVESPLVELATIETIDTETGPSQEVPQETTEQNPPQEITDAEPGPSQPVIQAPSVRRPPHLSTLTWLHENYEQSNQPLSNPPTRGNTPPTPPTPPTSPPNPGPLAINGPMAARPLTLGKVDLFEGDRRKFKNWFEDNEAFLDLNGALYTDDKAKIIYFNSQIGDGEAGAWKAAWRQKQRYPTGHLLEGEINYGTLRDYKTLLKASFEAESRADEALFRLNTLQQGKRSVEELNNEFRLLLQQSGLNLVDNEVALINMYKRALHPRLEERIAVLDQVPATYLLWMEKAAQFDRKHRQNQVFLGRAPQKPLYAPAKNDLFRAFTRSVPYATSHTPDPMAMDVDAVKLAALKLEERNKLMRQGLCFYCKEKGHLVFDCPTAPKRPNGQPSRPKNSFTPNTNTYTNGYTSNGRTSNTTAGSSNSTPAQKFRTMNAKQKFAHIRQLTASLTEEEREELTKMADEEGLIEEKKKDF